MEKEKDLFLFLKASTKKKLSENVTVSEPFRCAREAPVTSPDYGTQSASLLCLPFSSFR